MRWYWFSFLLLFSQCAQPERSPDSAPQPPSPDTLVLEVPPPAPPPPDPWLGVDSSSWLDLALINDELLFDIRYATSNNFTNTILYSCARCFLRPEAARALLQVQERLRSQNLRLLIFDCYRPLPIQWMLWETTPDKRYVSDPNKGSMHNRGLAVDLGLADSLGRELDMGTHYDFFGREAWPENRNFPDSILQRRDLLRSEMEAVGFRGIRTEWWHFSYTKARYALDEWEWPCPE